MSESQGKRWCFTINNPTAEDCKSLIGTEEERPRAILDHVQYLIFQEEKGEEEGTLHFQGFLILKQKKRLTWLKNHINPRAHWEIARGTNEQARDYCRKDDTYTGGLRHEFGEFPQRAAPKKREERLADAAEELEIIKSAYKRPAEIDAYTLMQQGFLPAYKELTTDVLGPYRPELRILCLIGRPGTGKSYAIQKYFPDHGRCICGNNGVWFQQPLAPVMVFEEFAGQIQLQRMLQFLDPYPLALEVKGGMRPALFKTVIITSNTLPSGWYAQQEEGGKRSDAILALWDRIGFSNGSYVPVRTTGTCLIDPGHISIKECRKFFEHEICNFLGIQYHDDDENTD